MYDFPDIVSRVTQKEYQYETNRVRQNPSLRRDDLIFRYMSVAHPRLLDLLTSLSLHDTVDLRLTCFDSARTPCRDEKTRKYVILKGKVY